MTAMTQPEGAGLTKVELHWRWLADRMWHGTFLEWVSLSDRLTKSDRALIARRVKAGQEKRRRRG